MTTAVIIGSTAAKSHIPEWREPKDLDLFASEGVATAIGSEGDSRTDAFWHDSFVELFGDGCRFATLDELYTIKHSHAYWELKNGSWDKHMADLVKLKYFGASLNQELHDKLYQVWELEHGKKVVDLTQESDEFFSDAVKRVYDHDSLHESVAYGDQPIYETVLKPGKSVQMDMAAIKALPFEDQVKLFREEIYVTALERLIVPNNYQYSPGLAYKWALRRTITSLTKGWSAKFIVSNFETFARADIDYVKHHKSKSHKLIRLEDQ